MCSKNIKLMNQQRIDILIRILFIENYYDKNDYGFEFYKAHMMHIHQGTHRHRRVTKRYTDFIKLIKDFEKNGFDTNKSLLHVNDKGELWDDGAHRLACCLYFNINHIPVKICGVSPKPNANYGEKYVKKVFNKKKCDLILKRYSEWISHNDDMGN